MQPSPPELTGEPVSFATSAAVLWMITVYGVLLIVSVFVSCLQARSRSAFGARFLRRLALGNAVVAVLAPALCALLGEVGVGILVGGVWFVLASGCLALSRLPLREPEEPVPSARVIER